nr:armadillo repeat-containing protein 6 [Ipomoea batatas]
MSQAVLSVAFSLCNLLHSSSSCSGFSSSEERFADLQSTEMFRVSGGPKAVVGILKDKSEDVNILDNGFSVVAAAATGNEVLKASFMDLKIDELIVQCLREHSSGSIPCLYDAIRVLLTSDDNRVVASQIGIAEALVGSLNQGIRTPSLMSACNALKAIAVNDEICRGVADIGGIDAILCCIDESGQQGNNALAKTCCSLLSKLAGSDVNKGAIVEKRGMERLIKISTLFSDDPSVLQEIMSIICVLSLRSPDKAARAIEAGAGDLAIHAMNRFPESEQLQRSACFMIRNLVVRNPENRQVCPLNDCFISF